jgi:TRAP-type C4-dicarboxylate transport system substrate-binding protein
MLLVEELVEKYSEGTIDVEVYPASQLGSNVEFSEGVALGEIEAAVCGFDGLGNYAPVANALCMPYLFTSNDDAMAKIWGDTAIHDALDEAFAEINLQVVGYVNRPFRVVCNSVRSVKTPADMKGLVLRSPTSAVNTAINSAMGANPVTISWGEVYTSMSQGACDAVENAVTELKSINLQETCGYITETNHTGGLIPMFVSKAWFDCLAPIQQEAILKGFAEVTAWREENLAADVAAAWQAFEDAGAEIVRLEDVDIAAFQEACSGVAAEFIAKGDFTQEFYDALKG